MEVDEEFSGSDTPFEDDEQLSEEERARKVLQGWTSLLPYPCESVEEMQHKLEEIIGMIYITTKAKNWLALSAWNGKLQLWMRMHYQIPKATRTRLIELYYHLCTLPGVDPQLTRGWADALNTLISHLNETSKLKPSDLQLDWKPLWRVLLKELYPKARIHEGTRNVVNILLYVAERSKLFYPGEEVKPMLDTFVPLITRDSYAFMVPVLTSFLPPFNCHIYVPMLLKLWQAFKVIPVDERLLDMVADLSQRHVSITKSVDSSTIPPWKDVGIWSEEEWTLLIAKGFDALHLAGMEVLKNIRGGVTKGTITVQRPKKASNQQLAFAKLLVYSMSVDGDIREPNSSGSGYIAGSRALDTLDRIMTSKETYYHPSNPGTFPLTSFLYHLASVFGKRWHEEQLKNCETPIGRRLTSTIRYEFVKILRTPALLSMFDKDNVSLGFSHAALRCLALLEPSLIMPELLERAFEGLEIVNETHRTTAVLSMLSSISRPLADEKRWLSGQKNIVPLLELAVPGIDLNDPTKTMCTTLFVTNIVQLMKIGDLSGPAPENPPGEAMDVEQDVESFPEGTEAGGPLLSRDDERALTRDSTAGFADWITSLLRRILALYENLPEEGGRRETTGGKSEETVLKGIKNMMDIICLHLSKPLFDLVLKIVYEYATTNSKANAVRAFGQLVSCLARAYPEDTINKFLPHCMKQIEEELTHGASSTRTTSSHQAAPSDTTLHWNISILRGIIGYGGESLLRYKEDLIKLMNILIDKTKSERGYSGASRFMGRVLSTLSSINPISSRFVNEKEWDDPAFDKRHNLFWGKNYEAKDVDIQWHVPSNQEIDFILNILDRVAAPALEKLESLLEGPSLPWDHAARNDFCRYLYACRSIWSGLSMLYQERNKEVVNPCIDEKLDTPKLLATPLDVQAGFLLTDDQDPRYAKVIAHKTRFGRVLDRATILLTAGDSQGEDHTDAVLGLAKALEVYILDYGISRSTYESVFKVYTHARATMRVWSNEKQTSRLVFVKRAYMYHTARGYLHSMYRRRSELDDRLVSGLVQLSLSPYTKIRRHAQSVLQKTCNAFVRATAYILPTLYDSLARGTDPDRMKGALYLLVSGPTTGYAIKRLEFTQRHLLTLVECQHEEKPSVQKLVQDVANEANNYLPEEYVHDDNYQVDVTRVEQVLEGLRKLISSSVIDAQLLSEACAKTAARGVARAQLADSTIEALVEVAQRPTTHWRYVLMACKFLSRMLRRDAAPTPALAEFFANNVVSPQPNIRNLCQRALSKLTYIVKMRTYSKNSDELWYHEWSNPLERQVHLDTSGNPLNDVLNLNDVYVDKLESGFITWSSSIKGYAHPLSGPFINWEESSKPSLEALRRVILDSSFLSSLLTLWGQETNKTGKLELRTQNFTFAKSIAKTLLVQEDLPPLLSAIESFLWETEKFKQRASSELLSGVLRGAKHWSAPMYSELISWIMSRMDRIIAQISPDTLSIWLDVFANLLEHRDPKRNETLIQFIRQLPIDFSGDSAFAIVKTLKIFGIVVDSIGVRFNHLAQPYIDLFFENMNTGYEEVRQQLAAILYTFEVNQRILNYPSTDIFLTSCHEHLDPLSVRQAPFLGRIESVVGNLSQWRNERLPPPLTSQSQYDKVGLTLLQWFYTGASAPLAPTMFPYFHAIMPEVLRMSELNDKSELQATSSTYLFVISATAAPKDQVEQVLDVFLDWIQSSSSWRSRRISLPGMVVFFFRNLLSVSPSTVQRILNLLIDCLADENVENREKAAQMLAGLIRVSQRQDVQNLKNRFLKVVRKTKLPARDRPEYPETLRKLHAGILGLTALIDSFPFSVESWVPSLITTLADHSTDPPPISTSIKNCANSFKKTHQDTWTKDQLAFDEDSLQALHTIIVGSSYYA